MLKLNTVTNLSGLASRTMGQIERAQKAALVDIEPVVEKVLLETIGTQYYSLATLKKMRGPYSAINPHPPLPPGVINKQTGELWESRKIVGPTLISGKLVLAFYITSRKTEYINKKGTPRMMGRDYVTLLQSRLRRQVARALAGSFAGMIKIKVRG